MTHSSRDSPNGSTTAGGPAAQSDGDVAEYAAEPVPQSDWPAELTSPSRFEDAISTALTKLLAGLEPGDRLPNERDVAAEFGVSRNALRDRIRVLETLGVIDRRQGSGTYLARRFNADGLIYALEVLVESGQMDYRDLHEVRVGIERQAAIVAATNRPDQSWITIMRTAIDEMDAGYGSKEQLYADVKFHRTLMLCCDNPAMTYFADALHGAIFRSTLAGWTSWGRQGIGRRLLKAVHSDIVDAIEAGDPKAAAQAVDTHFSMHSRVISGSY